MDRLQAMEVFTRVVESGSFTRAAESLRMPKATATTLVRNLESRLGVRLLNRTTRRVSVTPDGSAYYERCLRILADVAETEAALASDAANPRGRLRVDVPASFARGALIPSLPDFFARYPGIRLEIGCGDRPVDLVEEGVDCVVRGGQLGDSTLVARWVGSLGSVACAAPEYLARRGTPRHPEDLWQHACINYFSAKTGKIHSWDFTRGDERVSFELEGPVAVNDGDAYVAAGLAGLGIMLAPVHMVGPAIASGRLVRILEEWTSDPLPLYVMYPQSRHLSPRVRVFADWVAELIQGTVERWGSGAPAVLA